jgi:hypothetical protein
MGLAVPRPAASERRRGDRVRRGVHLL